MSYSDPDLVKHIVLMLNEMNQPDLLKVKKFVETLKKKAPYILESIWNALSWEASKAALEDYVERNIRYWNEALSEEEQIELKEDIRDIKDYLGDIPREIFDSDGNDLYHVLRMYREYHKEGSRAVSLYMSTDQLLKLGKTCRHPKLIYELFEELVGEERIGSPSTTLHAA